MVLLFGDLQVDVGLVVVVAHQVQVVGVGQVGAGRRRRRRLLAAAGGAAARSALVVALLLHALVLRASVLEPHFDLFHRNDTKRRVRYR